MKRSILQSLLVATCATCATCATYATYATYAALALAAADPSEARQGSRNRDATSETAKEAAAEPPAPSAPPLDLSPYVKAVEQIRGLAFKKPVASGTQSDAEFRAFVAADLDAEVSTAQAACFSRAFARLGLLPEGFDLRKAYMDMMSEQVAAYYDPYRKTFYIVRSGLPESLLTPTIIHELTHALQDQTFGLESRMKSLRTVDNDDAENAFRFLAEGEATYVMVLATLREQGTDPEKDGETLDSMIDAMSGNGREALAKQLGAMTDLLSGDAADIASVMSTPDYLFRVLYDPYFGGQRAVHKVRRAGGWAAVSELWKNPPASTEMLLHPEKLTRGRRDEPVKVTVTDLSSALGAGYAPSCENTLGELETEILLETTLPKTDERASRARSAAAGWGGDRWRAFEKVGGATVVVWKTVWDTEADAVEFDQAIRAACAARMPEGALLPPVAAGFKLWGAAGPAAATFLTAHLGKDVTLVAGASAAQARTILSALYPSLAPVEKAAPETPAKPTASSVPALAPGPPRPAAPAAVKP